MYRDDLNRSWKIIDDLHELSEEIVDDTIKERAIKERIKVIAEYYDHRFFKLQQSLDKINNSTTGFCHGSEDLNSISLTTDDLDFFVREK